MTARCAALAFVAGAWLPAAASGWKAGLAEVPITPHHMIWMAGFGDRTKPADGVAQELYAKALVLEDPGGNRAVVVTTDMLGFPAAVSRAIAGQVKQKYSIPRDRLLLNSSHTHCGPVIDHMRPVPISMPQEAWEDVHVYTQELEGKIITLIGAAIRALAPARLSFGRTLASFGVHRRMPGGQTWGPNYAGPVDHDVPILRIEGERGELRGVVFGYGCHNSTIGSDLYKFHGDYAGSAQKWLENRHPGVVTLFLMGCGGDVKPYPNDSVELAEAYGAVLAASVEKRMAAAMAPVAGALTTKFETVPLAFAPPLSREQWNERLKAGRPSMRRQAAAMLAILDRGGRLPSEYPYPLQAWQFGGDLTLLAMGGEVVSEYSLRLKRELGADRLWVAAYSNDVFAYIPSLRILQEGGYEGGDAMAFYLQPGPWAPTVEETIVRTVHQLVGTVRGE